MNLFNPGIYLRKPENPKITSGREDAKTFINKCERIVTNPPTTRREALRNLDELRRAEFSAFFRTLATFGAYYRGWRSTVVSDEEKIRSAYRILSEITGIDLGIGPVTKKTYSATTH